MTLRRLSTKLLRKCAVALWGPKVCRLRKSSPMAAPELTAPAGNRPIPLRARVRRLATLGSTTAEIAGKLSISIADVEMLLRIDRLENAREPLLPARVREIYPLLRPESRDRALESEFAR